MSPAERATAIMIVKNFLYRIGDWAKNNRGGLIKWLIIFALVVTIWAGTEAIHVKRFKKRRQAYEVQIRSLEQQVRDAEARNAAIEAAIETKNAKIEKLGKRVLAADAKLRSASELKKNHETIRYIPLSADSVWDTCAELAIIGYKCK